MANIMMNRLPPELTPEELAELDAAEKNPIIFDEDSPEMACKELCRFV